MTDYEIMMKEKKAKEIFEASIPEECRKCTILEKDYTYKTVKCIYRSKDRCILNDYGRKKESENNEKYNNTRQNK